MNLAFLLQDTGAVYGAERATMDLATGLVRAGVRVLVILIRESRMGLTRSALEEALRAAGLDVATVETDRRFSLGLIRSLRRLLKERSIDVLHTVGYKADVHGGFAARGRWPQVSTVHGWLFRSDLKERFYGWVNVRALKRCRRVVVLSRYYEDLLQRQGLHAVRIPSGLDAGALAGQPPRHGTFTLGMMARFSEEKNHAMLLSAVKQLVESGVTVDVVLAGDGPLRAGVEAEIARLDLKHIVKVKGYMPREDFLGSVDVLVMCSRIENLPYSVMEAMACSLPVIATSVGGLPDLVAEGVTGYLVPASDAAALAERARTLAVDRSLGQRLGAAGRDRIVREFSLKACIDRHLDLYVGIVE